MQIWGASVCCKGFKEMVLMKIWSYLYAPFSCHVYTQLDKLVRWRLWIHLGALIAITVFLMCTHHPSGALPLAVWVTSSQSQSCLESCLDRLKTILMHLVAKVLKKDLTFSWQMMTLARDKRLECTSNRLHSCCVFFTFCKQHGGG